MLWTKSNTTPTITTKYPKPNNVLVNVVVVVTTRSHTLELMHSQVPG
jgi:hypothetical protein